MSEKSKSKKTPKKHISSESEPKSKKSRKTKKPKAKSKIKRVAAPAEEFALAEESPALTEEFASVEDAVLADDFVPTDFVSTENSIATDEDSASAEEFSSIMEDIVPTDDSVSAEEFDTTEDFVPAEGSVATDEDFIPAEEFASAEDAVLAKDFAPTDDSVPEEDSTPADSVPADGSVATEDFAPADSVSSEEFDTTEDFVPADVVPAEDFAPTDDSVLEEDFVPADVVPAEDFVLAEGSVATDEDSAPAEDFVPAKESAVLAEESSELEVNNDGTDESLVPEEDSTPAEDFVPAEESAASTEDSAPSENSVPESLSASASSSSADVISGGSAVQVESEAGEKSADASRSEKNGQTHTLRVSSLYKMFGKKTVVQGVEFKMETGEVLGLLGPNGAGKTTTFYMIVGFHRPTSGEIFLDDERITGLPMYKRARLGISYLPQEPSVFRKLTVEENIWSILETRKDLSRAEKRQRLDELIEEFSIGRIRKQHAFTLSGGERRRTEIARSLAIEPKFLLLDEPFAGIDPIAVADIKDMIKLLAKRGIGVLITDHNVRDTLEITERAIIISTGQIVVQGNKDDILASPVARKIYLGEDFSM